MVLIENVISGVLALAFLVPLATGTYDLSIGAMMSMALVISTYMAQSTDVPQVLGMLLALVACAVAGFITGFFVVKLQVNSFIATLGMSQVITAFILHTSEQSINGAVHEGYRRSARKELFGLPAVLLLPGASWRSICGTCSSTRRSAATCSPTGGNPEAARLAGLRTDRLVWGSLVASGVIAGFAGIVYGWKVGNYAQRSGPGYLFPAIAAVFFGASQLKGRPNVWGTFIALLRAGVGHQGTRSSRSPATPTGSSRCSRAPRCSPPSRWPAARPSSRCASARTRLRPFRTRWLRQPPA